DVGATTDAGLVDILRGSASGLTATGAQWFTEDTLGLPVTAGASDYLGEVLGTGDANGDFRADLLMGMPYKTVDGAAEAGAVVYLPGSSTGVTTTGALLLTEATPNVPGTPEAGDHFGATITVGDFAGGTFGDVAIGAPDETIGNAYQAGTVTVIPGSEPG